MALVVEYSTGYTGFTRVLKRVRGRARAAHIVIKELTELYSSFCYVLLTGNGTECRGGQLVCLSCDVLFHCECEADGGGAVAAAALHWWRGTAAVVHVLADRRRAFHW